MLLPQGPLTFVAVRAALDELGLESTAGTPPLELPPSISRKLYEIIAITAMQFRGYIFKVNEPQVCPPCSTHPAAMSLTATGAASPGPHTATLAVRDPEPWQHSPMGANARQGCNAKF